MTHWEEVQRVILHKEEMYVLRSYFIDAQFQINLTLLV